METRIQWAKEGVGGGNVGRARVTTYSSNAARSSDALLVGRETGTTFLNGNLVAGNKTLEY